MKIPRIPRGKIFERERERERVMMIRIYPT
jgi:hypothetical protein